MKTLIELMADVRDIVQDYDDVTIKKTLNDGLTHVASRVLLPGLEDFDTVTTGVDHVVSMPAAFQRNLFRVENEDQMKPSIKVYGNPGALYVARRVGRAGPVVGVALRGRDLYYADIPDIAETLTLFFHRSPDALIEDTDYPECLPDFCHDMLVNFAAGKLYATIEDGLEGAKPNTTYHVSEFERHMEMLKGYIREGVSMPPPVVVRGEFL